MSIADLLRLAVEVLVLAAAIYAFIRFLQETQGSEVLKGFVVVLAVLVVGLPLLARTLELNHLSYVAGQGLPLILIGLVVLFQPELRHVLVKLGESRFMQGLSRQPGARRSAAEEIVMACERLARRGLGAIIMIERKSGIAAFTKGGVRMESLVSAPLLVTIFFKDTPLHDGAVIISGRRIVAAGCVLPLTENPRLARVFGTRHRAAVGATELNDAIAVVVSEETQRISVARGGELEVGVSADRLREVLAEGLSEGEDVASEGAQA